MEALWTVWLVTLCKKSRISENGDTEIASGPLMRPGVQEKSIRGNLFRRGLVIEIMKDQY